MTARDTGAYIDWHNGRDLSLPVKNAFHRRTHGVTRLVNCLVWECLI